MAEPELSVGDRVVVAEIRDSDVPEDLLGMEGTVQWVTTGYAGERGYVEVTMDDGRVFQFQRKELKPV